MYVYVPNFLLLNSEIPNLNKCINLFTFINVTFFEFYCKGYLKLKMLAIVFTYICWKDNKDVDMSHTEVCVSLTKLTHESPISNTSETLHTIKT